MDKAAGPLEFDGVRGLSDLSEPSEMGPSAPAQHQHAETRSLPHPGVNSAPGIAEPPVMPTQAGPGGIRFDFNMGARVTLPEGHDWRILLTDLDTGNPLFESCTDGAYFRSAQRYYVRFCIYVWKNGENFFEHSYDCTGREVLIRIPAGTPGDVLTWLHDVDRFAQDRNCRLTCAMPELISLPLRATYPHIDFVGFEMVREQGPSKIFYATYNLSPAYAAGRILGALPADQAPRSIAHDRAVRDGSRWRSGLRSKLSLLSCCRFGRHAV